jgi:putative ABC transport system permease protein
METLWQDVKYGVRMLLKQPGFTLVAILSLALGIGANTTIFTVVNAVFLRPLPVEEPVRLVNVFTTDERNKTAEQNFLPTSRLNYLDYRDQSHSFSGMAMFGFAGLNLTGNAEPEQIGGMLVTANYFEVLGVKMAAGRAFLAEEDATPGANPVVVLSHALWTRRFGADPSLVNKTIKLNGLPYTVVGVAPRMFRGTFALGGPDVWIPSMMYKQVVVGPLQKFFDERRPLIFLVFGRLKSGVSVEQAEADLKTIASRLAKEYPNDDGGRSVSVLPMAESTLNPNQRSTFLKAGGLLMTVVALVLLIACANLANLLLARASGRQREVAIRISLGASRGRLVRQLLTESLLLAFSGGVLGLLIAYWGRDILWAFRPPFMDANALNLTLDAGVLAFTFLVALLTGLLFGLVPAIQASRPDLNESLQKGGGRGGAGGARHRLRSLLVVSEVALALVALAGAGLFLRSLQNAQQIDPGFNTKNLLVMGFDVGAQGYDEARGKEFHRQVQERLKSLPMVQSSTIATLPPFTDGFMRTVFPEGVDPTDRRNGVLVLIDSIYPGYFGTLGVPVLRGREFTETDRENAPMVAVVNQAMADKFFPNQDALGKRFRFFGEIWILEIVGIARNSKYVNIGEEPRPYIYLSMYQHYTPGVTLHVRTAGDPAAALGVIRSSVQELDRNLPLVQVRTVQTLLDQTLWAAQLGAGLLMVFALLALALAAIGVYGVMSYSVSQRTHEIGIRVAMGAQQAHILKLILGQGLLLIGSGVVLGSMAAFAGARQLSQLLFNVRAGDPLTFLATPFVLAVVGLAACYIPARRATKVDPMVALRYE